MAKNLPQSDKEKRGDNEPQREKGDILAMLIAAAMVFLPIFAVLALILVLTFTT